MQYTTTPIDLNIQQLLMFCGAPAGLSHGFMGDSPFPAYASGPQARRCARMHFVEDGKLNGGIALLVYDPDKDKENCDVAFRQYEARQELTKCARGDEQYPIIFNVWAFSADSLPLEAFKGAPKLLTDTLAGHFSAL